MEYTTARPWLELGVGLGMAFSMERPTGRTVYVYFRGLHHGIHRVEIIVYIP